MAEFSIADVSSHNTVDDAWVIFEQNVYDISDFLDEKTHAGGIELILPYLGKDMTLAFTDPNIHAHTAFAFERLSFYIIGRLSSD
ncbi:fatty acid alpha-hydroxylase [Dinochytrium kinnereticum]|nr:fatty acid alpha-hydroxylase [Dinochytrium kinnereticum]